MDLEVDLWPEKKRRKRLEKIHNALSDRNDICHDHHHPERAVLISLEKDVRHSPVDIRSNMELTKAQCDAGLNGSPKKKERKRQKNKQNAQKSQGLDHNSEGGDYFIKITPLERGANVDTGTIMDSVVAHSELNQSRKKRIRRKRRHDAHARRKRNQNTQESRDLDHDPQGGDSLIKNALLETGATVGTRTIMDSNGSEMIRTQKKRIRRKQKHDAEEWQNRKQNSQEGKDLNHDPQGGDSSIRTAPVGTRVAVDTRMNMDSVGALGTEVAVDTGTIMDSVGALGTGVAADTGTVMDSVGALGTRVAVDTGTVMDSVGAHCNSKLSRSQKKRIRRNQKYDASKNNDKDHVLEEDNTLIKNMLPETESYLQPPVKTCSRNELEMTQFNGGVSLSMEKNKGKECNDGHSSMENYDTDPDLQMANGKHFEKEDKKSVSKDVKLQLSSTKENLFMPEKQSGSSKGASITLMKKGDVHIELDLEMPEIKNVKSYRPKKKVETHSRKRGKSPDSLNLEPIKEDGTGQTSSNYSEGAHADGFSGNDLETVQLRGHATTAQVLEEILTGEVSAHRSDGEPACRERKKRKKLKNLKSTICEDSLMKDVYVLDIPEGNIEQKNVDKFDKVHTAVQDAFHEDESKSYLPEKTSDDLSVCDPSYEHQEQKNVEKETKMQEIIHVLSSLGPGKDDANEDVTDKENGLPQESHPLPERAHVGCSKKKLLILDVNGLLADIVPYPVDKYKPDKTISKKAVFKRPFCDDFLRFCFERFYVAVWSSRIKKNVELVVDFLMGDSKHNLLFCWNQSHCTSTKFSTIENKNKPLVLKELQKLWDKLEPDLPWEKGEYNETNTLLLDDSPYKALRNPAHTGIFPFSYRYQDTEDNSLGPGGDLRVYLEGLAEAENVQKYVEQNPFGQRAITESNPSWGFYSKVIGTD